MALFDQAFRIFPAFPPFLELLRGWCSSASARGRRDLPELGVQGPPLVPLLEPDWSSPGPGPLLLMRYFDFQGSTQFLPQMDGA